MLKTLIKSILILKILLLFTICIRGDDDREIFLNTYAEELDKLADSLESRGTPKDWFWKQIRRDNFVYYPDIESRFRNMAEHRFNRGEIDLSEYKAHFGVDRKISLGKIFIEENRLILSSIQERNGIDFELIVAIIGMETNFAEMRHRGNFNVFDSLVSQYLFVPNRATYALNQIEGLYHFIKKTGHETDYFVGSFAGASGWAQFIPVSLNNFFVSFDGIDTNIDIFSIEDNLASIENYLFKHGLSEATMESEQHRRNAVFSYNRNEAYVQAVLFIYQELRSSCS